MAAWPSTAIDPRGQALGPGLEARPPGLGVGVGHPACLGMARSGRSTAGGDHRTDYRSTFCTASTADLAVLRSTPGIPTVASTRSSAGSNEQPAGGRAALDASTPSHNV